MNASCTDDCTEPPVTVTGENERDLRDERLAQLGAHELAELLLRLGAIHDRDDLRAPCRLHEPPSQLVACLSLRR